MHLPGKRISSRWWCRDESRISTAFLSALNTFLLGQGLDVSSRAAELHDAVHALLMRCWRTSRDAKLREALIAYMRIQLVLGGILGSHREDIGRALKGTLLHSSFKWWGSLLTLKLLVPLTCV